MEAAKFAFDPQTNAGEILTMIIRTSSQTGPMLAMTTLILGLVGASHAMGQAETLDVDGDGMVSYTELLVAMPDLTEAEFEALDTDGDTLLSQEELAAAEASGFITLG